MAIGNHVFFTIFEEKISHFIKSFTDTSKTVFYDEDKKKLIHAGEFGMYRENLCKNFLSFFIPQKFDIDTGFIINAIGQISTQCDIVIYDKKNTPLIQSEEHQKFYPVETVVGIGEVKSAMSFADLKKALKKLSYAKEIREQIPTPVVLNSARDLNSYDPKNIVEDQVFTFLICEKFNFKHDNLVAQFDSIYEGIDARHRHNMILSLNDGLLLYCDKDDSPCPYPIHDNNQLKNYMIIANEVFHFELFAQHINTLSKSVTLLLVNLFAYLGSYERQNITFIKED